MTRPETEGIDSFTGTVADFRLHLEEQRISYDYKLLDKIREGK